MLIPLRFFLLCCCFILTIQKLQAYPVAITYTALARIDGLSHRYDFLTGDYHMAWHDRGTGAVEYRRITPAGTLVTPLLPAVDSSEDPGEAYAVTAVSFDENSRPVVAYTKLQAGLRSIAVARWNGTAWIKTTVADNVFCNALSLDLYTRQASSWRLAYTDFTAPALRLASAGGGNIKVMDYTIAPTEPGVHLYYSANSGSLAWRVPGQAFKFANMADPGTGITAIINESTTGFSGDTGVHLSRADNAPGGIPTYVHRSATNSEILLTTRRAPSGWQTEIIARPSNPGTTTAFPTIHFDPDDHPIAVWSEPLSGTLHFAARIGGSWTGDSLSLNGSLLREPMFVTTLPAGGFHVHTVSQLNSNTNQQILSNFGPIDDFSDTDRDGVPVRLERAFMMNVTQPDRQLLPVLGTATIGGQKRLTLTVRQQPGGTNLGTYGYEAGGYQMLIQASRDLNGWVTQTSPLGIADSFTVSGTRFTTYFLQDPLGTAGGYRFLRVRVNRL